MRWRTRLLKALFAAVLVWAGQAEQARAQGLNMGAPAMPSMGSLMMPMGQMPGGSSQSKVVSDAISISDSFVSIIDAAAPRNVIMLRFDANYNNIQPMRGEYIFQKGGVPNSNGFPLVETKVDYQDFVSYAEYAFTPWFSAFIEAPYRWLNPEVNANQSGPSDLKWGMKLCTWSSDDIIATLMVRVYQPTARDSDLGTGHWSVEPGLLAAYRVTSQILVEGELRYWKPFGGSDFEGDLVRYGIGASYGQRNPGGGWFMPVLEAVGWTMLGGKTMEAYSPDNFIIKDAQGQTIINGYIGVRWGYGANIDFYAGYGRSFTGDFWQRDFVRLEARFIY